MTPAAKRKPGQKSDKLVACDSEDERPAKRGKSSGSDFRPSTEPKIDSNGEKYWEISKARRLTIGVFNGNIMVNVREYFEKDRQMLPGKKGISMTVEQYSAIIRLMPQIEAALGTKGETVPRPNYDGTAAVKHDDDAGVENDEDPKKTNIEATSEEEED